MGVPIAARRASMAWHRIADILNGEVAPGTDVTVKGWVRTRRDSKAGLSFIHVHDGSCFDPIQVVAPSTICPTTQAEVLKLTAGCSVRRRRRAGRVPGQGAGVRDPGDLGRGRRLGRGPRHLPDLAEAAHLRVPARGGPPAAAHEHLRRGRPRAPLPGAGDPPLLPRARLLLGPHADHHGERLRGRRRDVPGLHARPREPAAHRGRRRSTSRRTSSASRRT